jgi:hypothetical protein
MVNIDELEADQRRALDQLAPTVQRLGLYLAGGTALAFHLHHRHSRDVDLFSLQLEGRERDKIGRTRILLTCPDPGARCHCVSPHRLSTPGYSSPANPENIPCSFKNAAENRFLLKSAPPRVSESPPKRPAHPESQPP